MTDSIVVCQPKEEKEDVPEPPEDLLQQGMQFDSYDDFKKVLDKYCILTHTQFVRRNTRYIESYNRRTPNPKIKTNPALLYAEVGLYCIHGGRCRPSQSKGIRKITTRKTGCPVHVSLTRTPDHQKLCIKESQLSGHNHPIDEVDYHLKHLGEETEEEIYKLLKSHYNRSLIRQLLRQRLSKEIGKEISLEAVVVLINRICHKHDKKTTNGQDPDESHGLELTVNDSAMDDEEADHDSIADEDPPASEEYPQKGDQGNSASEPVVSEPVVSEPVVSEPVVSEPVVMRISQMTTRSSTRAPAKQADKSKNRSKKETRVRTGKRTSQDSWKSFFSDAESILRKSDSKVLKVSSSSCSSTHSESQRMLKIMERNLEIQEELLSLQKEKMKTTSVQEALLDLERKKVHLLEDMSKKLDQLLTHRDDCSIKGEGSNGSERV